MTFVIGHSEACRDDSFAACTLEGASMVFGQSPCTILRGAPTPDIDRKRLLPPEELSPSELRVLRFLPTNLTRPEIARTLDVSVNTVNTHICSIYSKLGASDRSSAVDRARELRLLATGRAPSPSK